MAPVEYRGCQIKDRADSMKIRGFIPVKLAPNAGASKRDFTRQYGTKANPGNKARKENAFTDALVKIDEVLASAGA